MRAVLAVKPENSNRISSHLCIVTFEFPPFAGGIASYVENLAREAVRKGPVELIVPRYADETDDGLSVHRLLDHHKLTLGGLWRALRQIRRSPRGTLVHAADIRAGAIALCARLLFGRRYIVMVHGSDVAKFAGWSMAKIPAWVIFRLADKVVANSVYTKAIYDRNFPSGARCEAIPLGVGPDWFEDPATDFENAELAALPWDARIICTVGRLEPRKGHILAIDAIAEFAREAGGAPPVYVIVGPIIDPDYEADIRKYAANSGVDVRLVGRISGADLRRLYSIAWLHLLCALPLPGKVEGFGLVLLEAAAQGCPSIATGEGGIPEVIIEGQTGMLASSATSQGVAEAMTIFAAWRDADDGAITRSCIEHARSFSWRRTAELTYAERE